MNQITLDLRSKTYTIPLTQGKFAIVDAEDYILLVKFKWFARYDPHTKNFYAGRHLPTVNGKRSTCHMHREIMQTQEGMKCDHVNHNTLDNRKENLRNCTNQENAWNTTKKSTNTSGFPGITWYPRIGKWGARVPTKEGRSHLGVFETKEQAHDAYVKAAKEHHGEFYCDK